MLGSLLALTKGSTATEEISCWLPRLWNRKAAEPTSTMSKPAAKPATQRRLAAEGAATDPEARIWESLALVGIESSAPVSASRPTA